MQTLIDIWRHERFILDGRSSNYTCRVQGGSNADNVLADAYIKGLKGGIDWSDGYAAMKTNVEVVPYNNFDPQDLTKRTKEGRGALLTGSSTASSRQTSGVAFAKQSSTL